MMCRLWSNCSEKMLVGWLDGYLRMSTPAVSESVDIPSYSSDFLDIILYSFLVISLI